MLLTDWWIVLPFEASNHSAALNIYNSALLSSGYDISD